MNEFDGSPKTWPPLGMPTGSVRALLTLIIVSVVITRVVRGDDVAQNDHLIWIETLLIALSHYFTARRFVELTPEALRHLEDDGVIERERHPLFLPKNSIRFMIVCAFGWLGYYLYTNRQEYEQKPETLYHAVSLLAMMGAFLLGSIVRRLSRWWHRGEIVRAAGTWGDLKALVVLIAMLCVAIPEYLGSPDVLNPVFHRVALGMMLFYFGSR